MKRVLFSFAFLALACWLSGCTGSSAAPEAKAVANPVAPTPTPALEESKNFVASGLLTVENQVDVSAQREGMVSRIATDTGARVHKGELLGALDDRQLVAERDAAADKVKSLEADVRGWEYETKVLEADRERAEKMMQSQLITQQDLDHVRYKAEEDKFETDKAKGALLNAKDTLKSLNLELEKSRIVAPFDGVVGRRYVHAGQKVAIGDRLFWVTATAPLQVKFALPEQFINSVKTGQALELTPSALAGQKFLARVVSMSPVVDAASGTIEITAKLDGVPKDLRPGMTVRSEFAIPK